MTNHDVPPYRALKIKYKPMPKDKELVGTITLSAEELKALSEHDLILMIKERIVRREESFKRAIKELRSSEAEYFPGITVLDVLRWRKEDDENT